MTGHRSRRLRRRQFLAGLGTGAGAAVAGCSGAALPWADDETSPTFTAEEAGSLLTDATPPIEWPVPVQPTRRTLEDALDRIDALLDSVPTSLGPEDVPNGVVREEIAAGRDEALEIRNDVTATGEEPDRTDNPYRALRETRRARDSARAAAATLTAVDADRAQLVRELEDERDAVRSAVRGRREATAYRGAATDAGRLRAALYCYRRESDLRGADRTLERWPGDASANAIGVGDAAGDLEFATATAGVWEHLGAQYEADVDGAAAAVDLESDFESALEASIDRADETGFPDRSRDDWFDAVGLDDLDDQRLGLLVRHAGREVDDARERTADALDDGDLATGLAHALEFEQAVRAFETVRDRIEDGTLATPETIDEIRTERTAALEAAAAAREAVSPDEPSLGAYRLAATMQSLAWADDGVRRAADNDPEVIVSLGDEFGDYVRVRAALEALPDAVDAFRDRLLAD